MIKTKLMKTEYNECRVILFEQGKFASPIRILTIEEVKELRDNLNNNIIVSENL